MKKYLPFFLISVLLVVVSLPAYAITRPYREVKYVAGKDNTWGTADDSIYHYFTYDFDKDGKVLKKMCFKIGFDNVPFTGDDELQDYQVFEYDPTGKITKETSYDGKNIEQYHAVYECDKDGKKVRLAKYNAAGEVIHRTTFEYDQANKLIKDVEYASPGDKIEVYHRFEYDNKEKLVRISEYYTDHQDSASSIKMYFYNKDGTVNNEKQYIGAGPDGKWLSDDDALQYYVLYFYR